MLKPARSTANYVIRAQIAALMSAKQLSAFSVACAVTKFSFRSAVQAVNVARDVARTADAAPRGSVVRDCSNPAQRARTAAEKDAAREANAAPRCSEGAKYRKPLAIHDVCPSVGIACLPEF